MERTNRNVKEVKKSPFRGKVFNSCCKTSSRGSGEELKQEEAWLKAVEAFWRKKERLRKIKLKKDSQELLPEKRIWLSKELIDVFLRQKNPVDAMGLYIFYRTTALWQGTDQPKATESFCTKGLNMGQKRFREAKQVLIKLGLIEQIQRRKNNNTFGEYYIKVKYTVRTAIFKRSVGNKANAIDSTDQNDKTKK